MNAGDDIRWANVYFKKDRIERDVRIRCVKYNKNDSKHIEPMNDSDFEASHKYYVAWFKCGFEGRTCSKSHEHDICYKKATIRILSGNLKQSHFINL